MSPPKHSACATPWSPPHTLPFPGPSSLQILNKSFYNDSSNLLLGDHPSSTSSPFVSSRVDSNLSIDVCLKPGQPDYCIPCVMVIGSEMDTLNQVTANEMPSILSVNFRNTPWLSSPREELEWLELLQPSCDMRSGNRVNTEVAESGKVRERNWVFWDQSMPNRNHTPAGLV